MAARDDGEFELILGNKQLLSVLFIVIILLGVFFTMGFLAGRSTGGPQVAQKRPADQTPLAVDAPNPSRENIPTATEPAAAEKPAESSAETPPPLPAPREERAEAPPKKAEPKREEPKREEAKKEARKAEPPVRGQGGVVQAPPAGTYLQAAATRRPDAEAMLSVIGSKTGLRGYVAPVPKSPELFRVLIGPLTTNESIASARVKLGELGVKAPYPVKY